MIAARLRETDATIAAGSFLPLRGRVAWAHDWASDPTLTATFQALPGASFTQVESDKIRSEQAYHDRQTMDEQLGLKVPQ